MDNSKIILITGGSRSGKSKYGEGLLKDKENILYIATAIVTDKEMEDRINKHRERRGTNFKTFEGYKDLDLALAMHEEKYVMLDCVTIMITNLMFENYIDFDKVTMGEVDNILNNIKNEFKKLIYKAREEEKTLVMVTNEVGYGIVPEYRVSRIFRDIAGSVNQYIAELSDEVYLVACGLPLKLK